LLRYLNSTGIDYIMQIPNYYEFTEEDDLPTFTTSSHRRKQAEQATFRIVATREKDEDGKYKLYLFGTNNKRLTSKKIRKLFKKRWGIETSYWMIRRFLARTISKI
jgi:IS4 transposase